MGRTATKMVLRLIAGEPVEALRVELATPSSSEHPVRPGQQPPESHWMM